MSVKFRDYYETLGVARTATQEEIQRAYRKLARQHHPDVDKTAGATERFGEINEAYEVLKDPEKRKKYDRLGANWKNGQDFTPPPGWSPRRGGGGARVHTSRDFSSVGGGTGDFGGFSDFFDAMFGGGFGAGGGDPFERMRAGAGVGGPGRATVRRGADVEAEISVPIEDALRGASRTFTLRGASGDEKTITVKIPAGVAPGSVIRLAGQGHGGTGGGGPGDLLLTVRLEPHPRYRVEGDDLVVSLPIAPWEAALGAKVDVPTLDGEVTLSIPAGTQSGQRMRIRGRGLPTRQSGARGDLFVEARIVVPGSLSNEERALYERLRDESPFRPRG